MFIRTVKVPSSNGSVNEYVRVVEAYRADGKVKQRVIADLVGKAPSGNYFGAVDALIDESLDRAKRIVKEHQ